jgi:hypothetical protein
MAMREFTLSNLQELDGGRVDVAFQLAMKRAIVDCEDRPGESKARVVTLKVEVTPVLDEDGLCEEVRTKMVVADKVPDRKSRVYSMGLRKSSRGPQMVFNDGDPGNFRQRTIEDSEA